MLTTVLLAFALTIILGAPTMSLLRRMQSIQRISVYVPEHQSKQGTPTMGGLMMLAAIAVGLGIIYVQHPTSTLWPFVLLVYGFATIGFLDDFIVPRLMPAKRGLGWIPKLALQFGIAAPICYEYFSIQKSFVFLSQSPVLEVSGSRMWFLATLVIVGAANAFNMTDGLDGLAAGTMSLAALGLLIVGTTDPTYPSLLVGACLGFLVYNAPPARVFMGDVGSMAIGAAFGFSLLNTPTISLWTILLCGVFLVELIPVPLQIASVKLLKRRMFLRTPIHHAFQHKGIPEPKVTAGFVLAQAICTILYVVLAR